MKNVNEKIKVFAKEMAEWIVDMSDGCMGSYEANIPHVEEIAKKYFEEKSENDCNCDCTNCEYCDKKERK